MVEIAATLFVVIVGLRILIAVGTWINSLDSGPPSNGGDWDYVNALKEQWWRERH
jgi:hypothetical protein